jgi:hypothetical protein
MRSRSKFLTTAAAALLATSACASTHTAGSSSPAVRSVAARPAPAKRNAKIILSDEIRASAAATAFELVQSLRPSWLNKRGPQSLQNEGDIHVYIGETRMGDSDALREIAAASISSIRYLDAKEANYKFGQGHPYGAIVISTVFPVAP